MKYKIGDRVKIKSFDWYNQNKDEDGFVHCGDRVFDDYMSVFCGSVVTIRGIYHTGYDIQEDMQCRTWTADMFECLVERNGKKYPYKIGDRVILKGINRRATITDLKYNSWGNLSYYIKIDNDKDIEIDYPTELLLPYDNVVEDVVDVKPQDKMVSLNDVCDILCEMLHEQDINDHTMVGAWEYDNMVDFVNVFRKRLDE